MAKTDHHVETELWKTGSHTVKGHPNVRLSREREKSHNRLDFYYLRVSNIDTTALHPATAILLSQNDFRDGFTGSSDLPFGAAIVGLGIGLFWPILAD